MCIGGKVCQGGVTQPAAAGAECCLLGHIPAVRICARGHEEKHNNTPKLPPSNKGGLTWGTPRGALDGSSLLRSPAMAALALQPRSSPWALRISPGLVSQDL